MPGRSRLDPRFFVDSVYAYNFNGETPRNLARLSHGKILTPGTGVFKSDGKSVGLCSSADASTRAYGDSTVSDPIRTSDGNGTGDFCIAFVAKLVAGATRRVVFHQYLTGGGIQIYAVANGFLANGAGSFTDQSGTLYVGVFPISGLARGAIATNKVNGQLLSVVFNRYGTSGLNELWINGRLETTYTGVVADCFTTGQMLLGINGRADQTGFSSNQNLVIAVYAANRALSPIESQIVSANHFELYQSRRGNDYGASAGASADLAGSATSQVTATGSLATQIRLSGAAASIATAAGSLTNQIRLSGAAASVAVANGVLTTQIRLSGAALAQVLASGALAASNAQLAGAASASAVAAGTLTTQIRLSGTAVMQALASAGLTTTPAGLSGSATATASASGALSTGIKLVGAASAIAIAAGGLTTGIRLSGAAAAVSNASGDLTISGSFSASALAQVAATGTLTTQIRLNAQAVMQALASASLSLGGTPTRLVSRHYLASVKRRDHLANRPRRSFLVTAE